LTKSILHYPIETLKGVGPARAKLLYTELGISSYGDFLNLYPRKYIDKTAYYTINQLANTSTEVQIVGKIVHVKTVGEKRGKRLVATFKDETGTMELVWFRGHKWIKESLKINVPYVVFGKASKFGSNYNIAHPEMELLAEHKQSLRSAMQPVYPLTEQLTKKNISNRTINQIMQNLFRVLLHTPIVETLSQAIISQFDLLNKKEALFNIHFPQSQELLLKAQQRLKFEELFYIQLQLIRSNLLRKAKTKGYAFEVVAKNFNTFYKQLPFELTNAQKRVIKEIRGDVKQHVQMNRLLQGDVGSGKTIVALLVMLIAIDNGFQATLMAPTEILAQQHYQSISASLKGLPIKVRLLTGSVKTKDRKEIHKSLEDGTLHILIGTHAIIEDKVKFKNLGLAIIDEQHRFGVKQRAKLWTKNALPPHILVMTATPIPRTLAMSVYGDLDISVIDELPAGRKPIKTVHYYDNDRMKVIGFMKNEIAKGRQIYQVFPLIEESEAFDYKDLMDGYEAVCRDFPLPKYSVSIVHGRMKPAEKELEMQRFAKGETDIMVATTVIEVGVNVPNASVMIIESVEKFGLSQLHQLRGRVGRGAEQSYCILMSSHKLSSDAKTRIATMVETNDGFKIAEVDLKLRGPGNLMGTQQSGVLNLRIADIIADSKILAAARRTALALLEQDPNLIQEEHKLIRNTFAVLAKQHSAWNQIS
jgi:ATP-dependent DNA helicase RecG